tara:strand:+ start:31 stop:279 length:249 start_codon:yes stop_codon:yes gene_type:complete
MRVYLIIDESLGRYSQVNSLTKNEWIDFLLDGIENGWVNANDYGKPLSAKRSSQIIRNENVIDKYKTLDWGREDYEEELKYV